MNSPSSPGTSGVVVSVPNSPSSTSGSPPSADVYCAAASADVYTAAAVAPKVNVFDPYAYSYLRHQDVSEMDAQTFTAGTGAFWFRMRNLT